MVGNIKVSVVIEHKLLSHLLVHYLEKEKQIRVIHELSNFDKIDDLFKGDLPDVVILSKDHYSEKRKSIEFIRSKSKITKVIIISSFTNELYLAHLISKGINGFIVKNHAADEIVEAIFSVVKNQYYLNQEFTNALANRVNGSLGFQENYPFTELSDIQQKILSLICKEYSSKEIAEQLCLSNRTVENYRDRLIKKVGAKNTVGLVMYAMKYRMA